MQKPKPNLEKILSRGFKFIKLHLLDDRDLERYGNGLDRIDYDPHTDNIESEYNLMDTGICSGIKDEKEKEEILKKKFYIKP